MIKKYHVYQALLGSTADVRTLDGTVVMKINPGTQPGATFSITGKGIKKVNSTAAKRYKERNFVERKVLLDNSLTLFFLFFFLFFFFSRFLNVLYLSHSPSFSRQPSFPRKQLCNVSLVHFFFCSIVSFLQYSFSSSVLFLT